MFTCYVYHTEEWPIFDKQVRHKQYEKNMMQATPGWGWGGRWSGIDIGCGLIEVPYENCHVIICFHVVFFCCLSAVQCNFHFTKWVHKRDQGRFQPHAFATYQ